MYFRPRRAARLAVAGCVAALLAGCSGGGFSSGTPSDADPGELRMLVNITPNLTKSYWEELVKPYEEANDVEVTIQAPSGNGVKDTLPQLLAAGNPPDVVETLMADEVLAPEMVDLTGQEWVAKTPLAEEAALDGLVYTVGVGMQAQSVVYYNADAFEKAGVTEPPQTLDEMTAAMAKLKKAGYLPLQTAGSYVTGLQLLQLANPSINSTHENWHDDVASGKITVGESMKPLLSRYADWVSKGYVDKNALGLKDADAQADFFAGKSAMYVMGSWLVSSADEAEPSFEMGAFAAPTEKGQPYPGPQGVTMAAPYMILKDNPNVDQATKLVEWLVTDEAAVESQLVQDGNLRPGTELDLSPLGQQVQGILDDAPRYVAQGEGYGSTTLPAGFNTAWNEAVQGLYIGKSPEDVAAAVDSWVQDQQ